MSAGSSGDDWKPAVYMLIILMAVGILVPNIVNAMSPNTIQQAQNTTSFLSPAFYYIQGNQINCSALVNSSISLSNPPSGFFGGIITWIANFNANNMIHGVGCVIGNTLSSTFNPFSLLNQQQRTTLASYISAWIIIPSEFSIPFFILFTFALVWAIIRIAQGFIP